jgi:hypothetical protein
MADNPGTFVRVSLPHGHFTVTAVTAARGGWRVLKRDALDAKGRPLPPKLREDKLAATPTDPEADASVDTPKE